MWCIFRPPFHSYLFFYPLVELILWNVIDFFPIPNLDNWIFHACSMAPLVAHMCAWRVSSEQDEIQTFACDDHSFSSGFNSHFDHQEMRKSFLDFIIYLKMFSVLSETEFSSKSCSFHFCLVFSASNLTKNQFHLNIYSSMMIKVDVKISVWRIIQFRELKTKTHIFSLFFIIIYSVISI